MKNISLISLVLLFGLLIPISSSAQDYRSVYGILLDNTGTMRLEFANVQKLGAVAARTAADHATISLFCFETQGEGRNSVAIVTSGSPWSQDNDILETYISGLNVVTGHTSLRDAIKSVGESVDVKAASENISEKIVILITDGDDRVSNISEKDLIKELKEKKVKVYAIGLVEQLDSTRDDLGYSPKSKAEIFLKKLTKQTGGKVIFPELKKDTKPEDLLNKLFSK